MNDLLTVVESVRPEEKESPSKKQKRSVQPIKKKRIYTKKESLLTYVDCTAFLGGSSLLLTKN